VMNAMAAALMLAYLAVPQVSGGELAAALEFVQTHPSVLKDVFLFSAAGALGQVFIFHTLGRFGSLSLVTITVRLSAASSPQIAAPVRSLSLSRPWLTTCSVCELSPCR